MDVSRIVKAKLKSKSENTIKTYKNKFSKWKYFAIENNVKSFPVNEIEFSMFLLDYMDKGASWSSLNGCISAAKFFCLNFDNVELKIDKDLELYLKKFSRKVNKQKRPLLKIEMNTVLDFYSNRNLDVNLYRDLSMTIFCWYAFLRYDDLAQLRVIDTKFD